MAKQSPFGRFKMAIASKDDRRKGVRRQRGRRKGDIEKIIIPGEGDKEQEVGVHQEVVPEKKAGSVWSWYEEFAAELSKTFITKKRKKSQKDTK
jgi:hypothetical protein